MTEGHAAVGQCPTEDALVAWHERGATRITAVGQHVVSCDACRRDVDMLEPPDDADPTGLGRYRLRGVISQGGFGVVCDAWDVVLQRSVAVKLTRAERAMPHLMAEAIDQARVSHPNVLSVLDAGTDGDATYVVMERVDGCDSETAALAPDFTAAQARGWVRDVARGLQALHERGLVHGDISPRNVLVGADGRARLIDFGSCRTHDSGRGVTLGFVAPEGAARPSVSGDVFALGRTLAWLLDRAGATPRDRGRSVVRRACQPSPQRRYETADAVARALQERSRAGGRARLVIGGLLVAVLASDIAPDLEAVRARRVSERAEVLIREGEFSAVRPLADTLRAQAHASGRDDVMVLSLLLDADVATAEGREAEAIALRQRAAAHSQGDVDAETRLQGLTARGLDLPAESADALLELAQGAALEPEQHSFVAAVRAVVDAPDPSRPLPEPSGPYMRVLQLAHVVRSLDPGADDAEPPPEVECGSMSGAYVRGLCWSVSAVSALELGDLEKAEFQASEAILLIDNGELDDPCDGQLAYVVRGSARLEARPAAAEADLRRASSLCPEDPPEDKAIVDILRAQALIRLGRNDEARTLEEGARSYAENNPDVAEGLSALADDRLTLRAD